MPENYRDPRYGYEGQGYRGGESYRGGEGYRSGHPIDIVRQEIERFIGQVENALTNPQPWSFSSLPRSGGYGQSRGQLLGRSSGSMLGGGESSYVPVDLSETEQAYILHAELPGLNERDVEVSISADNMLVIEGQRTHQSQLENQGGGQGGNQQRSGQGTSGTSASGTTGGTGGRRSRYHLIERSYGQFYRSIQLPQNIQRDQISAEFNRGILTVTVPKTQESQQQQRRIEIRATQ
jgi:HSP20 family molecular chaperone IbpA